MGCIKKLLMFLGVVFVLLIALVVLFSRSSANFRADAEPFISTFMDDFSANWDMADVRGRLTPAFVAQVEITVVKRDGVLRVEELDVTFAGPRPVRPPAASEA